MSAPAYDEIHRPQFHFTAHENWLNDPNGLVYYAGEYHLFFQHNPEGVNWGNMTWGHAISSDLVHWTQLDHAIYPDELGDIFSGSAVVDWQNTSGFQTGDEPPIVCIYTSAGDQVDPPRSFTQSIAFSNDRGRSFTKYSGNPVIDHIVGRNRDPKVFWHNHSEQWIMALYLEDDRYILEASQNLINWSELSRLTIPGASECPDLFELPIAGEPGETRWIFWGANGSYLIGNFDGQVFTPQSPVLCADEGADTYAAQTWSDIPDDDGRRIQIAWMRGGQYPGMPFNQQMSFPCELTLRRFGDGLRLCRAPVREIETLRTRHHEWRDIPLSANADLLSGLSGDLFDIEAVLTPAEDERVVLSIRGADIVYSVADETISCLGKTATLPLEDGSITLRILVDRTSIELYGNGGWLSMSSCFLPKPTDAGLSVSCTSDNTVASLSIWELASACQHC